MLETLDLGRGTVWFDAGTPDDLIRASEFVKLIQERSGFEIANLNEINNEFIKKK
jgi:glucose-1-phosphate thymidylyltransferase